MALFTMPRIGLENGISTIEKDNRSRVLMGFHRLMRSNSLSQGFTLIELLITVAILGIVAVIAAPSLQNFVLNNRIRAQAAALTSSLAFARTEAITRSTRVVTCPRTDSNDCDCSGDQEEWGSGWQVIVDINGDEICDSDDSLLEVHGPLEGSGTTLRGSDNVTSKVSFIYDGSAQPGTFMLCDHRRESHARAIEVLATGRIRTLIAIDPSVHSCPP
jgi:type IV fimbrial biogenesis protein FimT